MSKKHTLEKILIIPDCHVPWEDKKAFDLMLRAGKFFKPGITIIIGDFLDLLSCSRFDKSPEEAGVQFDYEILKGKRRLTQVRALGAKRNVFIAGNHEARLKTLLKKQALALYNTLTIPKLLELKEHGWEYVEYEDDIRIGRISYVHDTGALGPYAHVRSGEIYQSSVVHGHTHHAALSYTGNARRRSHVAAQIGWLGSERAARYLANAKKRKNWQHAFAIGYMEKSGTTHLQIVPIIEGSCVVEGELIS